MDPVDLTLRVEFHHSTWIGTGKQFSDSLPQVVYDKKREILKVPDPFLTRLPAPATPIHDFIHHPLPLQSSSLSFHQTTEWFSTDTPLTHPEVLLTRPIPPEKVLNNLDIAIGQMWFDGVTSIVDPRFNNGAERFPFWVLSLWRKMQKMIEYQELWKSSIRWLESVTHSGDVVEAKDLIKNLPWGKSLRFGAATTLEFAGFLGMSWLSDTQIDMMVGELQNRMRVGECAKGAVIEPLAFYWELVSIGKGWKDPLTSPYLLRLASQVQDGATTIWFPININNNHWIAGRIDFEDHTFAFGEL